MANTHDSEASARAYLGERVSVYCVHQLVHHGVLVRVDVRPDGHSQLVLNDCSVYSDRLRTTLCANRDGVEVPLYHVRSISRQAGAQA